MPADWRGRSSSWMKTSPASTLAGSILQTRHAHRRTRIGDPCSVADGDLEVLGIASPPAATAALSRAWVSTASEARCGGVDVPDRPDPRHRRRLVGVLIYRSGEAE